MRVNPSTTTLPVRPQGPAATKGKLQEHTFEALPSESRITDAAWKRFPPENPSTVSK